MVPILTLCTSRARHLASAMFTDERSSSRRSGRKCHRLCAKSALRRTAAAACAASEASLNDGELGGDNRFFQTTRGPSHCAEGSRRWRRARGKSVDPRCCHSLAAIGFALTLVGARAGSRRAVRSLRPPVPARPLARPP